MTGRVSIPGRETRIGVAYSTLSARFSTNPRTWSNLVVNKFNAVMIPPFGPRLYLP